MKISEIINEDLRQREFGRDELPDYEDWEGEESEDEDLKLGTPAKVDSRIERVIVDTIRDLISQTITEIETPVIINAVVAKLKIPFTHIDLVKINNASKKIQHYIDTIDLKKVKFKTDGILTAKNEDPKKEKEQSNATIGSMAARAASRRK